MKSKDSENLRAWRVDDSARRTGVTERADRRAVPQVATNESAAHRVETCQSSVTCPNEFLARRDVSVPARSIVDLNVNTMALYNRARKHQNDTLHFSSSQA